MKNINLSTERLEITAFNEQDISNNFVSWLNDKNLMYFSSNRNRKHSIDTCKQYLKTFDNSDNFYLAIKEKELGLIGTMTGYVNKNYNIADIGILIGHEKARNRGFGKEAFKKFMLYLSEQEKYRKITAGTVTEHIPMVKIMERAGMIDDGIRKKQFVVDNKALDIIHKAYFS